MGKGEGGRAAALTQALTSPIGVSEASVLVEEERSETKNTRVQKQKGTELLSSSPPVQVHISKSKQQAVNNTQPEGSIGRDG